MKTTKWVLTSAATIMAVATLTLTGCNKSDSEKAADGIDRNTEKAKDGLKDAGEKTKDALKDAADKTGNALKKAGEKVRETVSTNK